MNYICLSVFLLQSWTWSFPVEGISAVTPTCSSLVSEHFSVWGIQFHTTGKCRSNMQTNNVYFLISYEKEATYMADLFVYDGSNGNNLHDFQFPCMVKCLTNRNAASPMESIRVRWIRWTPWE